MFISACVQIFIGSVVHVFIGSCVHKYRCYRPMCSGVHEGGQGVVQRCSCVHEDGQGVVQRCSCVHEAWCRGVHVFMRLSRCMSVVVPQCSWRGSRSVCSGPARTGTPPGPPPPPAGAVTWRTAGSAHPATPTCLAPPSDLNQERRSLTP